MTRHALALPLLPLLASAGLSGCGARVEAGGRTPTAVRVRAVEQSAAASATRYSATIHPASRVDVAFRVGGYVQRLAEVPGALGKPRPLQDGDPVTAGMELATVRTADYAQKLAEARAAHAEAQAAREQAQLDFDRATRLAASGTVTRAELDAARVRLDAVGARVEGARVRVAEAGTVMQDTRLKAPMSGVVVRRAVEVGTLAAPGTVAFSIADTSSVKVVFGVPDTELPALRLGSRQPIVTESHRGREFEGVITRIAPIADPKSRVFEVEVTVDNADGELKPGMIASLQLEGRHAAAAVAVLPIDAIVRMPGSVPPAPPAAAGRGGSRASRFGVFIVEDEPKVARLREVELGEFLGNQIPIRGGLRDGDQVVVMGASLVEDGEPVRVIP